MTEIAEYNTTSSARRAENASPSAAAGCERIIYLCRALPASDERAEIEQRATSALGRCALLERIARLATARKNCREGMGPTLAISMKLRAALAELAQESR